MVNCCAGNSRVINLVEAGKVIVSKCNEIALGKNSISAVTQANEMVMLWQSIVYPFPLGIHMS